MNKHIFGQEDQGVSDGFDPHANSHEFPPRSMMSRCITSQVFKRLEGPRFQHCQNTVRPWVQH